MYVAKYWWKTHWLSVLPINLEFAGYVISNFLTVCWFVVFLNIVVAAAKYFILQIFTTKMDQVSDSDQTNSESKTEGIFKKPILIGKIGRLPRKIQQTTSSESPTALDIKQKEIIVQNVENSESKKSHTETEDLDVPPEQQATDNSIPLPYKEPSWSGIPRSNGQAYAFEVLKNGTIIDTINLMEQAFWVFGRLPNCNISMQHPTISR